MYSFLLQTRQLVYRLNQRWDPSYPVLLWVRPSASDLPVYCGRAIVGAETGRSHLKLSLVTRRYRWPCVWNCRIFDI